MMTVPSGMVVPRMVPPSCASWADRESQWRRLGALRVVLARELMVRRPRPAA
jgi:hypothetical protein